jgi:hypothetical protein
MPQRSTATMHTCPSNQHGARFMNPSHSLQVPQLADPFMHAGGWEKLGWRCIESDTAHDRADALVDEDEAEPGLYS